MASLVTRTNSQNFYAHFRAYGHEYTRSTGITKDPENRSEAQEIADYLQFEKRKTEQLEDAARNLIEDPRLNLGKNPKDCVKEAKRFWINLYLRQRPGLKQKLCNIGKKKRWQ